MLQLPLLGLMWLTLHELRSQLLSFAAEATDVALFFCPLCHFSQCPGGSLYETRLKVPTRDHVGHAHLVIEKDSLDFCLLLELNRISRNTVAKQKGEKEKKWNAWHGMTCIEHYKQHEKAWNSNHHQLLLFGSPSSAGGAFATMACIANHPDKGWQFQLSLFQYSESCIWLFNMFNMTCLKS